MRIHLAYDHATWELGRRLATSLLHDPTDPADDLVVHAPENFDDGDDYPPFVLTAALATLADQDRGVDAVAIVLGSSPTGAVIAVNKVGGVRAVLGNDGDQVRWSRQVDDANVLVLDHRGVLDDVARKVVDLFRSEDFDAHSDHVRRAVQILEFENAGTIAGWQLDYAEAVLDADRGARPAQPQALVYSEFGAPSVLRIGTVPEQHPGPGQVGVAVKVVGLNPIDARLRVGRYQPPETTLPLRGHAVDARTGRRRRPAADTGADLSVRPGGCCARPARIRPRPRKAALRI